MKEPPDQAKIWLAAVTPTRGQRRLTLACMAAIFALYTGAAPFAAVPLPEIDSFTPAVEGILSIAELVTAVFLFSQFVIGRSRALLLLASGYLYSALVVIPHALTFPRSLAPVELLAAGEQSAGWLYIFWHFGFLATVIAYILLKDRAAGRDRVHQPTPLAIVASVTAVFACVIALTWVATAGNDALPRLLVDDRRFTPLAHSVTGFNLAVGVLALLLLWRRRKSVLDQWLMVAVSALIAELAIVTLFLEARFNFGFYFSRLFAIVSSLAVLIALLAELSGLYGGLSRTVTKLRLERESKLLSLETLIGATAHQVKQPLTSIALEASTALRLLKREAPDLEEIRAALNTIVEDAFRGAGMLGNIRALLTPAHQDMQPLTMNDLVRDGFHILRCELTDHAVLTEINLAADLPWIIGHKGQLLQVIINLLNNAVEAVTAAPGRRVLRVRTERKDARAILVTVEDSGPGLSAELTSTIFDPFVPTKPFGMGLELALCHMIVERHGGSIAASSESGSGARFQITLPTKHF